MPALHISVRTLLLLLAGPIVHTIFVLRIFIPCLPLHDIQITITPIVSHIYFSGNEYNAVFTAASRPQAVHFIQTQRRFSVKNAEKKRAFPQSPLCAYFICLWNNYRRKRPVRAT
jgi:hypothetical protein